MTGDQVNNEIDLKKAYIGVKDSSLNGLRSMIKWIKRNFIIIILLVIVGYISGFLIDSNFNSYKSHIIVKPNFETADYLYEKVALLDSKIKQQDVDFWKHNHLKDVETITEVSIKPIPDIYKFVSDNEDSYQIFQILTSNNNANNVILEYATAKNYPRHLIEIKSKKPITDKTLKGITSFFNNSEYYSKMRVLIHANVANKIKANKEVILQIDEILEQAKKAGSGSSVYVREDNNLNDLVENKLDLVHENHSLSAELVNLEYIVTPITYYENLTDDSTLVGRLKYYLPLLFLGIFILFKGIVALDKS